MAKSGISAEWQLHKSLKERNGYMLRHAIDSDVSFSVRNKATLDASPVQIEAHKYMLISASPVFRAMLCGDFPKQDVIEVMDIDPEAFKQMLRFIYTEDFTITGNTVMQILHASKKYNIPTISEKCTKFLQKQLCPANVCMILEQSEFFQETALSDTCLELITKHTKEALQGESFLGISLQTLDKILDCERLSITERDLFECCLKWARAQLSQKGQPLDGPSIRRTLGVVLYKIHLPVIPVEEFGSVVSKSGVLSMEEELELFRYMSLKEKPANYPLAFPTTGRGSVESEYFLDAMKYPNYFDKAFSRDLESIVYMQTTERREIKNVCILTPLESTIALSMRHEIDFARDVVRPQGQRYGADDFTVDTNGFDPKPIQFPNTKVHYVTIDVSHLNWVLEPQQNNQIQILIQQVALRAWETAGYQGIPLTTDTAYTLTTGRDAIDIQFIEAHPKEKAALRKARKAQRIHEVHNREQHGQAFRQAQNQRQQGIVQNPRAAMAFNQPIQQGQQNGEPLLLAGMTLK